jgi:hypothetical protein
MDQKKWIVFSGFVWMLVGVMLLRKGFTLTDNIWITVGASFVGWAKGRFVLGKTVKRVVARISMLSKPIRIRDVYTKGYWMILGSMMLLGMVMRVVPLPIMFRAFVDIAVGVALVQGALLYFRAASELKAAAPSHL